MKEMVDREALCPRWSGSTITIEAKYIFRLGDIEIPVRDVPINSRTTYSNEAVIQKLQEIQSAPGYWSCGRLTSSRVAEAIGYLARKWFYKGGNQEIKAHLVIPPELICQTKMILESAFIPEYGIPTANCVSQFIGGVWIDAGIHVGGYPNWPWFLFASVDLILGSQVNPEGMMYFAGTCP